MIRAPFNFMFDRFPLDLLYAPHLNIPILEKWKPPIRSVIFQSPFQPEQKILKLLMILNFFAPKSKLFKNFLGGKNG